MKIPVLINNRDLLCRDLVDQCRALDGAEVYVIDNGSTYPPTVEWWEWACGEIARGFQPLWRSTGFGDPAGPCGVRAVNGGPRAACWYVNKLRSHWLRQGIQYYATTDSDLDLTGVPADFLQVAVRWLMCHPELVKVGVALDLDMVTSHAIVEREADFWRRQFRSNQRDELAYLADIDTTLAVYRLDPPWDGSYGPSVRLAGPYTARHLPWYHTRDNRPPDYQWYMEHCDPSQTVYTRLSFDQDAACKPSS